MEESVQHLSVLMRAQHSMVREIQHQNKNTIDSKRLELRNLKFREFSPALHRPFSPALIEHCTSVAVP